MQPPAFERLHPWFRWVRDYLTDVAPAGRLPGRSHIDPAQLGAVLSLINLVDVVHAERGLRFRFRLVGTAQTIAAGREITGCFVEDAVLPNFAGRILRNMRTVVETGRPAYDRFGMPHPGRDFIVTERVYFPLASDGRSVDMLLTISGYPPDLGLMPPAPVPCAEGPVRA